ncbi:MAG: hypothetical protein AB8G96_01235 [Phycisphaerales bacterium]
MHRSAVNPRTFSEGAVALCDSCDSRVSRASQDSRVLGDALRRGRLVGRAEPSVAAAQPHRIGAGS